MDMLIILIFEEEIGFLRHNSSNVIMCCMDMEVLLCSYDSFCNFYLVMEVAGFTGTDVKRVFTS